MNKKYLVLSVVLLLLVILGAYTFFKYQNSANSYNTNTMGNWGNGMGTKGGKFNASNNQQGMGMGRSKGNCVSDECLAVEDLSYPAGKLSADAESSLIKALDDEYKAYATYDAVIKKLGNVRPFIMIIRAEEQHISMLKSLFDKYDIKIPENTYINKVTSPETLVEACKTGVTAEVDNAALYKNTLIPAVKSYEDITSVFTNLRSASEQKHLVAFERCAN